jgi:DEAD/DEAH box helicase domain-containing protein
VSLRSVSSDNFVVQDTTPGSPPRIVAEVDYDSAPSMVHEKAIYILEGRTYYVERYDHEERRVEVREAEVDYYTDAITYTKVRVLDRFAQEARARARRSHGEVHVTSQVVGFKKIKFHTNENVGAGELTMPENEMHTTAYWLTVPREVVQALPFTLEERRDGVVALSYTLGQLAALFLMCDRHDLGVALGDDAQGEARVERGLLRAGYRHPSPESGAGALLERGGESVVFIYDAYPGGIGLSEPLYRLHDRLVAESRALIAACGCRDGCPSCVGPAGEAGTRGKEVALAILDAILAP